MFSDYEVTVPLEQVMLLHAGHTWPYTNNYFYTFSYRGQWSISEDFKSTHIGPLWVIHCDELFYIYNGAFSQKFLEREQDWRMSHIITTLWTNFAKTGNPTPDTSLGFVWEPVNPHNFQHLNLTLNPTMVHEPNREGREFLETLLTEHNMVLNPDKIVFPSRHSGPVNPACVTSVEDEAMVSNQHCDL